VRVDLGCGHSCVAECDLHGADVCDAKEAGGECVSEHVGGDLHADGGVANLLDGAFEGAGRDRLSVGAWRRDGARDAPGGGGC